jgi:LysR family transcriptional activator of nhaA
MFEAAEELSDHLKQTGASKGERCRIGVTREIERPFIADILTTILRKKKSHEQPLLSMTSEEHASLLDSLRSGELDAMITNHPVYGPDVCTLAELSMPVIAVATQSTVKSLGGKRAVSLASMIKGNEVGLVLPSERLRLRIETDIYLQKLKIRNPVVFESDILAVVVRAVTEGVGIAFLPKPYIARELNQEALEHVGGRTALWNHSMFIVTTDTRTPNPIANEIREHFLRLGGRSMRS